MSGFDINAVNGVLSKTHNFFGSYTLKRKRQTNKPITQK